MKLKFALPAFALAAAMIAAISLSGCNNGGTPTLPDPAKIANLIEVGTSGTVALGFVAIPDAAQAADIAKLAEGVIDTSVLPVLNGDNARLAASLDSILSLKAFDDPKLVKVKLVLEA